ncbi:twin-arginine translocase subunit TatB [Luteimonas sp. MC1782]|uniref:Sec-independent protein translocase protein TatB n=1 Tax=Luteimonas sp. MC1782 TaxID=2760305 RepID=UPI0016020724|nr:Sec-independent protein translocase protein TatB [Luteimonas sp. MC1782]MBB1473339.1 twin-arginine translocase subunit TatB [Luteimonas sp. MC1782]
MFDLGFGELLLIAVVALVVLGPERLPKAARFAGLWVRRARAQWYSVKSELERELAAEELKRSIHETREAAGSLRDRVRAGGDEMQRDFERMRDEVSDAIEPWAHPAAPAAAADADPEPADAHGPARDVAHDGPVRGDDASDPGASNGDAPPAAGDAHVRGDR